MSSMCGFRPAVLVHHQHDRQRAAAACAGRATSALILPWPAGRRDLDALGLDARVGRRAPSAPRRTSGSAPPAGRPRWCRRPRRSAPARSRKPRRSMPPCTYWSNRRSTSGSKSAAVRRGASDGASQVSGSGTLSGAGPCTRLAIPSKRRACTVAMKITARPRHRLLPRPQLRHPEDRDRRGPDRPRRRHAQRPRTGGRELPQRPRHPLPDRPRRAPDRGHLAVPLPRRLLAARPGDDERDRRGRHRAVGHQGQGRRHAAVPAARRREPHAA